MRIADNLLLYQRDIGGWDKNIDMALALGPKDRGGDREAEARSRSALHHRQRRYLHADAIPRPRLHGHQRPARFQAAFRRGLEYLLKAQYPNGGWPQFYPLRDGYWSHITYNDDAMVGVLELLRDIVQRKPEFAFLGDADRARAQQAIDKAVECILKTQVVQDGKLTVWCAQHDERTLAPAKARAYELPSLSGNESVGIVRVPDGNRAPVAGSGAGD